MRGPRITLDQWRALVGVVEANGYARAAEKLHKSQSTLTYSVQQIERLTGVKVFAIEGRKAALTQSGRLLYERGRKLVEEAVRIEATAAELAAGWESELRVAVEIVFPTWLLLDCFARFAAERPHTRIELYETVMGGTSEALLEGRVDLAISPEIPQGFLGEPLMQVRFVPAAAPQHPLHRLGRPVTASDLAAHRHLVVRESGSRRTRVPSAATAERWTMSHKATSIRAAVMGLGFAWYPEENIREELGSGKLKALPLRDGAERFATLYLIVPEAESAGPGVRRLAEIVRERVRVECGQRASSTAAPRARGRPRTEPAPTPAPTERPRGRARRQRGRSGAE